MRRRRIGRSAWVGLSFLILLIPIVASPAATPRKKPFAIPRDRASWDAQRSRIRQTVLDALGPLAQPALPVPAGFEPVDASRFRAAWQADAGRSDGAWSSTVPYRIRRVLFGTDPKVGHGGYLITPDQPKEQKAPAILFLGDDPVSPGGPLGYRRDIGEPPALVLGRLGYHVYVPDTVARPGDPPAWLRSDAGDPEGERWPRTIGHDRAALDLLLAQPDIDPRRVGVMGVGSGGMRAWWLMALDERIACGVALGGITRLSDCLAVSPTSVSNTLAPWAAKLLASFDTEAVMALCAPRHLQILGGDRDPLAPESGFVTLRDTCKKVYRLHGEEGPSYTLFGDYPGGLNWLGWASALETFDKQFLPQGPSRLGHAPEPEPQVDASWVDPAEHGIAGWVVEMSQRPTTWSWQNGVIACRPGPFEYGWLRLPVEFDDFLFQVEWKVPRGGNSGVFLRAAPVNWTLPVSEKNKQRVATLGETWPSRTGLELQAQDDPGHADKYSSASLYRHAAPTANPSRSPDQWNRYTVRAIGPRIAVWCNGGQVMDTTLAQTDLLRRIPLRGFIGLQNHGAPAEFRNIRYRALPPGGSPTER
ncbi:MAG: DUF1080 domain-containing protein [Isosphaeraceae bacterium]